jgi:hypothetical protein
MSIRDDQPPVDAGVEALRDLLRDDMASAELPPWFTARVMHEVRRSSQVGAPGQGWVRWIAAAVGMRVLGPALLAALVIGGWMGYRGGTVASLHLAEVRYIDEVDPVHAHP